MKKNKKSDLEAENKSHSQSHGDNSVDKLRKRHLKDKNDKITDEDLRNIKIDTSVTEDEGLKISKDDTRPHDVDKDHKITTPWDVIKDE